MHADAWPWPTFLVNLAGAALLGWLLAVPRRPTLRPLVGTGFCGAVTTFSGLQVETLTLAREGSGALAVAYPVASLALGLALAVAGAALGRRGSGT